MNENGFVFFCFNCEFLIGIHRTFDKDSNYLIA